MRSITRRNLPPTYLLPAKHVLRLPGYQTRSPITFFFCCIRLLNASWSFTSFLVLGVIKDYVHGSILAQDVAMFFLYHTGKENIRP